jgi:hypothetical protein
LLVREGGYESIATACEVDSSHWRSTPVWHKSIIYRMVILNLSYLTSRNQNAMVTPSLESLTDEGPALVELMCWMDQNLVQAGLEPGTTSIERKHPQH